jgi:hypothetical protein
MRVLFVFTAIVLLAPSIAISSVDLPWTTSYDCDEWEYGDSLTCDGLQDALGSTCDTDGLGRLEQITTAANYTSGGGGRGQRHWLGDGKNDNSGGLLIYFSSNVTELWVRFYLRFPDSFVYGPSDKTGYKVLYMQTTSGQREIYLPLYSDGIGVCDAACSNICTGCWTTEINDGEFHSVEFHIKSETVSDNDGIAEVWIDGERRGRITNMDYGLISEGNEITGILLGSNLDSGGSGACEAVDYDDFAIYSSSPPNTDSQSLYRKRCKTMSDEPDHINVTPENLALHIQYISKDLREICHKLDSKYVTKAEFNPVRLIAYGLVSVLLVGVISALIGKVGI